MKRYSIIIIWEIWDDEIGISSALKIIILGCNVKLLVQNMIAATLRHANMEAQKGPAKTAVPDHSLKRGMNTGFHVGLEESLRFKGTRMHAERRLGSRV